ncbi:long-chain fatty acid--CoA ligase [Actinomycetospora soli]|uniref:long-chain fatty acid--CoA ligase n=1 Tax=Actinomycetospora soli TaxID=2893887 RepID=UPI001E5267F8|nr:long-chain fatty acid--CoA ligase [Actinomycetospora soli]MCD2188107.1 long-chain fatty acid--CoA ligase [Actinomycetospora soli]
MRSTMQDRPLTVGEIVTHAARVHPDREVVTAVSPTDFRRVSYRQTAERAARLANGLRELGVTGDQRVGTLQWSNQEHLDAYAGIPSMGAVLHTLNLRLPPAQLSYVATHAEDSVLIVDGSLLRLLAPALPAMPTVHTVLVAGEGDTSVLDGAGKQILRYDDVLAGSSPSFDWPDLDERAAAAMCYTSGTTAAPKGVVYSHRSIWLHSQAACTSNALGIGFDDTVLAIVPMFHANAWGIPYACMMSGAGLLLPGPFLQAAPLVEMIEHERPTMSGAVPTIWHDILGHLEDHPDRDISSIRFVACGGSAVPRSLMEAFDERGVTIVQAWGMTETSPLATVALPPSSVDASGQMDLRCTQGRPVAGVEVRLVDDDGRPQPHDGTSVGEIQVRGPWVTASYYGDEDAEKFDDGWLRTGDVGVVNQEQFVTLTDRAKDVIKSGGEWISSVALENEIVGHPEVHQAAVVAIPDEKWQERPLAAVVRRPGSTVSAGDLRRYLTGRVAKWWLPDSWTFVEEVPLTGTGKYDKKVLRRRFADGELAVEQSR